jgi:hypothetical protein
MQVDHRFHENLTPARVDAILEEYRGKPAEQPAVTPGAPAGKRGAMLQPPGPKRKMQRDQDLRAER